MSKQEEIVGKGISDAIGGEMAEEKEVPKKLSRKDFVKDAAVVAGAGALASCAPAAAPAPADTPVPCPTCPPAEECPPCPEAEAGETVYDVFPPYGVPTIESLQPAPRLDTLDGKTICGIGGSFHGEETFPVIADLLAKKYPTAKFVPNAVLNEEVTSDWEAKDPELIARLMEKHECDALIVGNGC